MKTKIMLLCWICNKKYDKNLYDEWLKDKKVYYCDCGGQIISNSGKVVITHIKLETKEDLRKEIKFLEDRLKDHQKDIEKMEVELNRKINFESHIKNKIYKLNKEISDCGG